MLGNGEGRGRTYSLHKHRSQPTGEVRRAGEGDMGRGLSKRGVAYRKVGGA